jgi:hypothetical protein
MSTLPFLPRSAAKLLRALFAGADAYERSQLAEEEKVSVWRASGGGMGSPAHRAYQNARDKMLDARKELAQRAVEASHHPQLRKLVSSAPQKPALRAAPSSPTRKGR